MAKAFDLSNNESKYLENIGLKISEIRKKNNWSLENLAEKLNMARQNLHRIEKGQVNSTIIMLSRIANALEVQLEDLI